MSEKRRPRTAAALATSVVLHLVCALLLLRGVAGLRSAPARVEGAPTPIEFSLLETPRPDQSGAVRPEVSAPPPHPGRAPGKRPIEPNGTRAAEAATPAAPLEPAEAATPRARPPIDLSFDALGDGAKRRAATVPNPGESLERLLVPAPESTMRRQPLGEARADAERRADAEENVRVGRAHPLLFDYLRDARERLTPEATRIAEALPLGPAETTKGWGRGYLQGVADAHRGLFAPLRPPDETVGGPRPDLLGGYDEAERQAESGAEQRVAEICLGVAPDHTVVVTLRRSSGNAALDRLALSAFQSAGGARPVAPDVRPALACYRVGVSAHRVPPLPAVSLDLVHGRLIYPLKRITKVTVELQSVDFGPKRETSNLLHAR